MKKATLYELAVKLGGLYLFILSLNVFKEFLIAMAIYFESKSAYNDNGLYSLMMLANFSSFALTLAFAFFLTFFTGPIVKKITAVTDLEEDIDLGTDKKGLYEIALVLAGIVLIITTLPEFAVKLKEHYYLVKYNFETNYANRTFLLVAAARIVLGILIIAGAQMIASFFAKEKRKPTNI